MSEFLPFVVAGLSSGSIYGLAGLGLVLTFKTTGIFNFAHGAVGAIGAYAFYELHTQRGVPWPIAFVASVLVLGPLLGLLLERVARGLSQASQAMKIVATIGLLLAIQSLAVAIYGGTARSIEPFFPARSVEFLGVYIGVDQLINVGIALVAAVLLYQFFRLSRLGQSMQAVVDDPDLLALCGTSPLAVRRWAWVIGATFAALSAVLLVPFVGLEAITLTLLVVQAFGAAAVGAFNSLALTYAGGVGIGVLASVSTKYVGDYPQFAGLPPSLPFIVLFVALLVTPTKRLVDAGAQLKLLAKPPPDVSNRTKLLAFGGLAVFALAVPELFSSRLALYTDALTLVAIFLSLYLLVRSSGQVSLAHASFAAVGAAAFSHLAHGVGLPWLVALIAAGLVAVPVGAIVAIPAIRLSGVYLAVATFGFGVLLERLLFTTGIMFGSHGVRIAPRPSMKIFGLALASDRGYFYVVLAVVALLGVLVAWIIGSRHGRLLRAMSDSPLALATYGADVNLTRVIVFCFSAFIAGIAGALYGGLTSTVNAVSFPVFDSLLWVAVLAIAGFLWSYAPVPTAVTAALLTAVVPSYSGNSTFHDYLPVSFGLFALGIAVMTDRKIGSNVPWKKLPDRAAGRGRRSPVTARTEAHVVDSVEPVGADH